MLSNYCVRRSNVEPPYLDAYLLLGEIYEERLDYSAAAAVYRDAL